MSISFLFKFNITIYKLLSDLLSFDSTSFVVISGRFLYFFPQRDPTVFKWFVPGAQTFNKCSVQTHNKSQEPAYSHFDIL